VKILKLNANFWISFAVFQVVFGLAVFAITRDYYMQDTVEVSAHPPIVGQLAPAWPNSITETQIARLSSSAMSEPAIQDPFEISRRANEYFANRQYDRAADMYEQLLAFSPNDAEIYNNLGLTLHYLGRSTEALGKLNEGVVIDPEHQRIWLTLGYVNSQLGNTEQARAALNTAVQIGTDESVRQSAMKMLEGLP
jgi:tetratricopeptide (TPR) repeat protein